MSFFRAVGYIFITFGHFSTAESIGRQRVRGKSLILIIIFDIDAKWGLNFKLKKNVYRQQRWWSPRPWPCKPRCSGCRCGVCDVSRPCPDGWQSQRGPRLRRYDGLDYLGTKPLHPWKKKSKLYYWRSSTIWLKKIHFCTNQK